MIATVPYVEERFAHFNELCFGGELPSVVIKLSRARTYLGRMEYRNVRNLFGKVVRHDGFVMRISTVFDLSESRLDDVIVHEMIHCHIAFANLRDTSSHGRIFRSIMKDLNARFGLDIQVSHRLPDAPVRRQGSVRVCLSKLDDGEYGVTVCSEAMSVRLKRILPRFYRISESRWFVSDDPFFSRFPHSRSPKIYKISQEDAERLISEYFYKSY